MPRSSVCVLLSVHLPLHSCVLSLFVSFSDAGAPKYFFLISSFPTNKSVCVCVCYNYVSKRFIAQESETGDRRFGVGDLNCTLQELKVASRQRPFVTFTLASLDNSLLSEDSPRTGDQENQTVHRPGDDSERKNDHAAKSTLLVNFASNPH